MLDIVEKICYRELAEMKTITYFMRQKQKIKELQIMKKYLALVLSALILIGCLSACSSNEPAAKATDPVASAAPAAADSNADRVLNIGISSEISNIVPMSNNVAVANRDGLIVFALYDPLIWYDTTTDTLKPWIATEWSHSEDGKEWYFTLRDDVYFHNGDKMTAEDVAWSLNLIPENPVGHRCQHPRLRPRGGRGRYPCYRLYGHPLRRHRKLLRLLPHGHAGQELPGGSGLGRLH